MTISPVGFAAKGHPKNPGFVTRMTEQRLVDESCTTQYSSPNAASAGVASTPRPRAQIIAFFIIFSKAPSVSERRGLKLPRGNTAGSAPAVLRRFVGPVDYAGHFSMNDVI